MPLKRYLNVILSMLLLLAHRMVIQNQSVEMHSHDLKRWDFLKILCCFFDSHIFIVVFLPISGILETCLCGYTIRYLGDKANKRLLLNDSEKLNY